MAGQQRNYTRYNENDVQGFYYDHQMYNPIYTITLHPNTRPFINGDSVKWDEGKVNCSDDMIITSMSGPDHPTQHWDKEWDAFFTDGFSSEPDGSQNDGILPKVNDGEYSSYYAEPICSSIFTEDFNFNITNEWTSWDGGNFIEGLFKNLKPFAPMVGTLSKNLSNLKTDKQYSGVAGWLTEGAKTLGDFLGDKGVNVEGTLNKALYIQGTRYSLYNGTSTQFGNMVMKFTLLSDWRPEYPGSTNYKFVTVYDQFQYIFPYVTGFFEKGAGELNAFVDKFTKEGEAREVTKKFLDQYIGWQSPPGGFTSINRNIDVQQKGTLRLVLGGFYTIDNLVVKNINVNFSRQLCKCPKDDEVMVPLYADIVLELQPASVYTDIKLGRFLNNDGMQAIQKALTGKHHISAAEEQDAKNKDEESKVAEQ